MKREFFFNLDLDSYSISKITLHIKKSEKDFLFSAFSAILEKRGVYKSTSCFRNETADTVLFSKTLASVIKAERSDINKKQTLFCLAQVLKLTN